MVAACVVNHEDDTHLCLVAGKSVRRMERWFRVCRMGWNWESPRGRRESVERGGGCFGVVIGGVRCGNAAGPQSLGASNGKIKKKEEGRAI